MLWLSDDLRTHIIRMLECQRDLLHMRAACKELQRLLSQPGVLLGCKACAVYHVDFDLTHLRTFMWAKLLGQVAQAGLGQAGMAATSEGLRT